jgi:uncharacterized cupin superfamily protein
MSVIDSRVVNLDDLQLEHFAEGSSFESRSVRIGPALGAKSLGYSYDIVPPGKRACPFHSHRGEEEMFLILRGTGLSATAAKPASCAPATSSAARSAGRKRRTRSSTTRPRSWPTCR